MSATKEWTHADRRFVSRGPWDREPDKIQWVDDATGLDCLMHRAPHGAWCGYVGVAEGHPYFAKDYDELNVDAHGGLTYADFCQDTADESRGVCHVPEPGRPHKVWWLGFDCAHFNDATPGYNSFSNDSGVYRNRAYVENECRELAAQLAKVIA